MSPVAFPAPSPPVPAAPRAGRWRLWLAGALVLAVYLASAAWQVFYAEMNTDEGFYAVATRAVAHGEVPYRDFGFTQPPLVLYANCLPLRLLGFGLFPQRALNGLWAALAVALAAVWLARRTRPAWGLALALGFALSAPWMYFVHLGKTYGVTTLLVMLAAWCFLAWRAGPRRNFALGLLAALGAATRLPAIPCFAVLWLLALWPRRRPTLAEALAAAGGLALGGAAAILPFWLAAPEAAKFWVFDFQLVSVPEKHWHLAGKELLTLAPATWVLAGLAVASAVWRRRILTREFGVLLAAGVTLAANLLPRGVYDEYATPFLLPFATAAAALVFDEIGRRGKFATAALAALLAAAQFLPAPLLFDGILPPRRDTFSQWLTPMTPPYNRALPAQLARARRIVAANLPPDAPFVGPNLILATETHHRVPPDLRMGAFSCTDEMMPDRAARLHLATRGEIDLWYARPDVPVLAFFKRLDLDYNWSMPSFALLPEPLRAATLLQLQHDFNLADEDGVFFILVRKRDPGPPLP